MENSFTFIDLFAGIGGFHIALSNVGGKCVGYSEIAQDAIEAYCKNFNESKEDNLGDITKLETLPRHDFLTAGVPCQSWSCAGKKLGFDDQRGQLWFNTLSLLETSKPKAFIFENVKGLTEPRNKDALEYIMNRIREAGYYANIYILNAYDYGVPQARIRLYIVGFDDEKYYKRFKLGATCPGSVQLGDILDDFRSNDTKIGNSVSLGQSLSSNEDGINDYFLFNDMRGGQTTIHSWDIQETTDREKSICNLLLKNRRKAYYGNLDGNPLSFEHFKELDETITNDELEELVNKHIFRKVPYTYQIIDIGKAETDFERLLTSLSIDNIIKVYDIKNNRAVKKTGINVIKQLSDMENKGIVKLVEARYDFKNAKASTGINGINRIFLPTSKIYPTLVASDSADYISTVGIEVGSPEAFKRKFLEVVYAPHNFRRITKEEACRIQSFPDNFILPETRARWMKLLGNSVCPKVVQMIAQSVVDTGIFEKK